ncbi:nucleotide exchange factor GrpE [bacterium]|nr:nucleotide exchange factor GrpE [bacterium]
MSENDYAPLLADWSDQEKDPLEIGSLVQPLLDEIASLRTSLALMQEEIARFEAFEGARGVESLTQRVNHFEAFLGDWKGELAETAQKKVQRESVRPLLAGVDALVRARDFLATTKEGSDALSGIGEVISLFDQLLSPYGFSPIEPSSGSSFDPTVHLGMGKEKGKEGKVVRVLQRGWHHGGKLMRPAEVTVGNGES